MQNILSEIQNNKTNLKKVEQPITPKPIINTEAQNNLAAELNKNVRDVDIEEWYDALKEHTYPTTFVEITLEEGRAFFNEIRQRKGRASVVEETNGELLKRLQSKLEEAMVAFPHGAFVKLSSRSPKDATVGGDKTIDVCLRMLINV